MELKQVILRQLEMSHQRVLRSLEELTEADVQQSPTGNLSPVVWQVGHLAWSESFYAGRADGAVSVPPTFAELFRSGTGGKGTYPPLAEVTSALGAAQEGLAEVARGTDLAKPVEGRSYSTVGELLLFACFHRGYHYGKIATLRALLGKPIVLRR